MWLIIKFNFMFKVKINFLNDLDQQENLFMLVKSESFTECETVVTKFCEEQFKQFSVESILNQKANEVFKKEDGLFFEVKISINVGEGKSSKVIFFIQEDSFKDVLAFTENIIKVENLDAKIVKIEEKQIKYYLD